MQAFVSHLALGGWVVASLLLIGISLCHGFTPLTGLRLVAYGAATGVFVHALIGIFMGLSRQCRVPGVVFLILLELGALGYFVTRRVQRRVIPQLAHGERTALLVWGLFLFLSVSLLHVNIRFADPLPDGRYVFKDHGLNVKMQSLTSLPADNLLPFAVTEYLLRRISFREERPLLPGNEVSNRTILMSLVALPFRGAFVLTRLPKLVTPLPRFRYVGQDWPNVETLNTGDALAQCFVVYVVLNGLLPLGALAFFSGRLEGRVTVAASICLLSSPYLFAQVVFTWPKALGGFFVLLAWDSLRRGYRPWIVGGLLALAYHAHPFGVAYIAGAGGYYLWKVFKKQAVIREVIGYFGAVIILLAPWWAWTLFILRIPGNLVAQNVAAKGASISTLMAVRLTNLVILLSPVFPSGRSFHLRPLTDRLMVCLPFAVGVIPFAFAARELLRKGKLMPWHWFAAIVPGAILFALFSMATPVAVHGWQPIVVALIMFGTAALYRSKPGWFIPLVAGQLAINLSVIALQAWMVGAHLP